MKYTEEENEIIESEVIRLLMVTDLPKGECYTIVKSKYNNQQK